MSSSTGYAGTSGWEALGWKRHEESFYAEHRQRRDDAAARGEDPYAEYKRMVQEKRHVPRTERLWNKLTGKSRSSSDASTRSTQSRGGGDEPIIDLDYDGVRRKRTGEDWFMADRGLSGAGNQGRTVR
ncbi:hypothetical protein JX265_012803 [Neoarthrinium moseri]|uniref:Uncharacterized protein n=1 Tax=Neoarthrinium moseri TaxID=1658444 RepID=A0A9P9W9K5_9PEZI|nr:hypothetical protein JX266_005130 [Neoarthrinium moseri]KAI1853047.1 hypothetical protein JX265_012803 [Neoarthrinium moseri]